MSAIGTNDTHLYQNTGGGLLSIWQQGPGIPGAWGDVDRDSDLDFFLDHALFLNRGGYLSNDDAWSISIFSPFDSRWADMEADGDLDLVLVNTLSTQAYRNNSSPFSAQADIKVEVVDNLILNPTVWGT